MYLGPESPLLPFHARHESGQSVLIVPKMSALLEQLYVSKTCHSLSSFIEQASESSLLAMVVSLRAAGATLKSTLGQNRLLYLQNISMLRLSVTTTLAECGPRSLTRMLILQLGPNRANGGVNSQCHDLYDC